MRKNLGSDWRLGVRSPQVRPVAVPGALVVNPTPPLEANAVAYLAPQNGQTLRAQLHRFLVQISAGQLNVRMPLPPPDLALQHSVQGRGQGHFHLGSELFLQVTGYTRFEFPAEHLMLHAGEVLLLPPKLLHAEAVGSTDERPFCNLVMYAEGGALSCHVAHALSTRSPTDGEAWCDNGDSTCTRPEIEYLEVSHQLQALQVQAWLGDAARLQYSSAQTQPTYTRSLVQTQVNALVAAALAGVLRTLDEGAAPNAPELPALVARVRVMVQNQLGDQRLSVNQLAQQCGCTADYLSHLFSQAMGQHLTTYIVNKRLERAASLLGEGRMAGKEVAWACGFASQSYFIRSFKAKYGATPRLWSLAHSKA